MDNHFTSIYFDITNFCNADCPYCTTGLDKQKNKHIKFISVSLFKAVLDKLLDTEIIKQKSLINLYDYGEPLLHPKLNEVVDVINALNLTYGLSTNASICPDFSANLTKNLQYIKFSMSGFSQASYDKIHCFSFEQISKNIESIVKKVRKNNRRINLFINYHLYQFNLNEVILCKKFADKLRIGFQPNYAIINDWDMLNSFIDKQLSYDELFKISQDIMIMNMFDTLKDSPKDGYFCPQNNILIINENADVITCCQLPTNKDEYKCGNLIKDDIDTILKKRKDMLVCKKCTSSGLAYYLNNSLKTPDWYGHAIRAGKISTKLTAILNKIINRL